MRVAITIGLAAPDEPLWVNGIKQTALALARTLAATGASVRLANTTDVSLGAAPEWLPADLALDPLAAIEDAIDLLVVLGGVAAQPIVDRLSARGVRVVACKCGSEYVLSMQAALFESAAIAGDPHYVQGLDALWLIPQIAHLQRGFYETLHRMSAEVVPFLWDPAPLERAAVALPSQGRYTPGRAAKRLSVIEANRDVVKYCLVPLMIAEGAYRRRPEAIDFVSVTNTQHLRTRREFVGVVNHLDLVRHKRCFFEDRFTNAWFLAHHTDVVIAHQWENPLNYAYLEAAWLGYPLVHNAGLCADLGYHYPGFDVATGTDVLLGVLARHDDDAAGYAARQRERIAPYLATAPANVTAYARLVERVMARERTR